LKTKGTKREKGAQEGKKRGGESRGVEVERVRLHSGGWEWIMGNGTTEMILCQ